jgi:hypothetical protein
MIRQKIFAQFLEKVAKTVAKKKKSQNIHIKAKSKSQIFLHQTTIET